jgi:hypothetical protein
MNSNLSSHLLSVARMMKAFIRVQIMGWRLCLPDTMNTKRNPKPVLNHFLLSLSSICRKTWPIPIDKKSNNKYTISSHSIFAPRDGIENECQINLFKCFSLLKVIQIENHLKCPHSPINILTLITQYFRLRMSDFYSFHELGIECQRKQLVALVGLVGIGRNPVLNRSYINTTKRIGVCDRLE